MRSVLSFSESTNIDKTDSGSTSGMRFSPKRARFSAASSGVSPRSTSTPSDAACRSASGNASTALGLWHEFSSASRLLQLLVERPVSNQLLEVHAAADRFVVE